jgi:enhancer of mRNA-decapping protein 3
VRWASEDIQGIKNVDFDFAANLSLFDKQSVFNEIRQQDKTDPNARLVAHNQLKPAGLPGKIPNNEMITQSDSNWDFGVSSSSSSEGPRKLSHNGPLNLQKLRKSSAPGAGSGASGTKYKFVARNTNGECPCASPVQIVELERLVAESFGINESMLSENAARGVAELALKALGGRVRFQSKNKNSRPCVVALIGDHRAGCRALGALRHLSNRLVTTIAVVPSKDVRHSSALSCQLQAFEASGGKVVSDLTKLRAVLSSFDSPVELIIDGLQGYQTFEDIWDDDALSTAISLIEWANSSPCDSISLDIPAGLDASTGLPGSQQTFLRAKWVLSCGFPLTGTMNAHLAEIVGENDWTHYLIDVGIPRSALTVGSMKRFENVWFGANWYIELSLARP